MSLKIVVRFLQYLSILLVLRPYGNICTCWVSCGTDPQLQSAMIINTVPQVQKNVIDVYITCKASVDNTEWVSAQRAI